jgi:tetratricopeptide (TPR) repeat protein
MAFQSPTQHIDLLPHTYFKKALSFIQSGNNDALIQHIDCAIVFSSHSPFYIYQKIKLLFQSDETTLCSSYILDQLYFLYKHASLYLLCRSIDYYQTIHHLSSEELAEVLKSHNVPYCLAVEYENLLNARSAHLADYAQKALIQDNFMLCVDYCTLLIKQRKYDYKALYLKAYGYHMLGCLYKACDYYKKSLAANDKYDIAYCDLGLALMELNSFKEALQYLNIASYLEPSNLDYLSHIAECHYALKEYALAEKTFESILALSPDNLQTYFNLSYACKKQNKRQLAKKYVKTAQRQLEKK